MTRLNLYFEKYKCLSDRQVGFRKHIDIVDQVSRLTLMIKDGAGWFCRKPLMEYGEKNCSENYSTSVFVETCTVGLNLFFEPAFYNK